MARTRTHQKNIACLESLWDGDLEDRLSVEPVLRLAASMNGIGVSYLTCNTADEFKHNVGLFKRRAGYGVLYLAFHGSPGQIELDGAELDLETLALLLGKGFRSWLVHFGTCGTVAVPRARMQRFLAATGVSLVVGYGKDVDWVESAALDLLLLDRAQAYKDMRRLWSKVSGEYRDLVRSTGMRAFHP